MPIATEQLANVKCVFADEVRVAYRKDLGTSDSRTGSDWSKSPSAPTSLILYCVIFYLPGHLPLPGI